MHSFLKQSTAAQSRAIGPFVDDTDFKTAETALTIANTDIKLIANGGASANKNSGGGTHRVNGEYGVTFDATDSATVGELAVSIVMAGALPVFHKFFVLEEAVYDALFGASAPGYASQASVDTIDDLLDTEVADIRSRLPAALVGGRMDSSIGGVQPGIGHDLLAQELRKYNVLLATTTTAIRKALTKVGGGQAVSADWTPATGDVKRSIDGGTEANVTNLPTFVNGRWEFIFSAAELSCKILTVRIADQGTKVILDADFEVYTFGHASAFFPDDASAPSVGPTDSGTAQAGGANTITLKAGAPSVGLKGQTVSLQGGTGAGQSGVILSYNTSTKVATMTKNWETTNPDSTTVYVVSPTSSPAVDANLRTDVGLIEGTDATDQLAAIAPSGAAVAAALVAALG